MSDERVPRRRRGFRTPGDLAVWGVRALLAWLATSLVGLGLVALGVGDVVTDPVEGLASLFRALCVAFFVGAVAARVVDTGLRSRDR